MLSIETVSVLTHPSLLRYHCRPNKQGFLLQISIMEGPALATLHNLVQQQDGPNTFDFAFIGKHGSCQTVYVTELSYAVKVNYAFQSDCYYT